VALCVTDAVVGNFTYIPAYPWSSHSFLFHNPYSNTSITRHAFMDTNSRSCGSPALPL